MDREKRGKRNAIIGLSLLVMATIFATSLATFSWLSANSKVHGGMGAINIKTDNITGTQMKSYSVTEISADGNEYTFINHEEYTLPRFDPANIDYTEYEKALVFRVNFTSKDTRNYRIVATTKEDFHTREEIEIQNEDHLSNCSQFRIGQTTTVIDADTFESAIVVATDQQSFVNYNETTESVDKVQEITIANITATQGENVVYVVMQYNTPVIEYINGIRKDNANPIDYVNDISFEFKEVE